MIVLSRGDSGSSDGSVCYQRVYKSGVTALRHFVLRESSVKLPNFPAEGYKFAVINREYVGMLCKSYSRSVNTFGTPVIVFVMRRNVAQLLRSNHRTRLSKVK